ncbi:SIR2 family protein [Macrococcoides caseolyticum]|uniref:SIR2 family protein n=1 Tax=Macrococcoides caseolyticum TaxID=69966 RepID=UPI001F482BFA|nr:SIR2 family protein [Macrococcus caseolyticus]MCE4957801.1 SIR2 family protein [Macrococcus caseolyticus]
MIERENFIKDYLKEMLNGSAAIFGGAGLSIPSGYMDWKTLVEPLAKEIGLNIEKEHDLITVMQYYSNEVSRPKLDGNIMNSFEVKAKDNDNLNIVSELPINTFWTTNYDSLIEDTLKKQNKIVDVKRNQESLVINKNNRDAVVYKMHGDILYPSETVITKDDYDTYGMSRPFFRTTLQSDLLTKTFLFIGFSFEDPNLDYILSQIKILLHGYTRSHYCFMKKISVTEDDYEYRKIKQKLKINDLKRYNIYTILVDEYSEITDILNDLKERVYRKNVFISSAIESNTNEVWTLKKANDFGYKLSKTLIENNYKVVSGYGKGINSSIITGALEIIYKDKFKHTDEFLKIRPFPYHGTKEMWTRYREDTLKEVGITIFIFGNKYSANDELVISDGMKEEFNLSIKQGAKVIPVGSTGGASKEIFDEVKENIESFSYLDEYLEILENSESDEKLLKVIMEIIENLQK